MAVRFRLGATRTYYNGSRAPFQGENVGSIPAVRIMAKEKMKCTHCGDVCLWYPCHINETDMYKIEDKIYCGECIKKIARYYLRHSNMD